MDDNFSILKRSSRLDPENIISLQFLKRRLGILPIQVISRFFCRKLTDSYLNLKESQPIYGCTYTISRSRPSGATKSLTKIWVSDGTWSRDFNLSRYHTETKTGKRS